MAVHPNIYDDKFPKQGSWLNQPVSVCFNYDTSKQMTGRIVREDAETPGVMIIALDNGRFVLSTECQYQLLSLAVTRGSA